MKVEIEKTTVIPMGEAGDLQVRTDLKPVRADHITIGDAEGAVSDKLYREAGKATIESGIVIGATMWAFSEIAEGFNQTDPLRVAGGLAIYGLANGFGLPHVASRSRDAIFWFRVRKEVKSKMLKQSKK